MCTEGWPGADRFQKQSEVSLHYTYRQIILNLLKLMVKNKQTHIFMNPSCLNESYGGQSSFGFEFQGEHLIYWLVVHLYFESIHLALNQPASEVNVYFEKTENNRWSLKSFRRRKHRPDGIWLTLSHDVRRANRIILRCCSYSEKQLRHFLCFF